MAACHSELPASRACCRTTSTRARPRPRSPAMSSALALEKSLTIAYFGPEATFTHQAAVHRFGNSLRYVPLRTIQDVFQEVARGRADYGVVPVENSTEGVVTSTLDMFVDSELKIVSEIVLPIQHCLVGKGTRKGIAALYSHPQALSQCKDFLAKLGDVELVSVYDTAGAASRIKESGLKE